MKQAGIIRGTVEKGDGAITLLVPQSIAASAVNTFDVKSTSREDRLRVILRDATPVRLENGAIASVQLKLQ